MNLIDIRKVKFTEAGQRSYGLFKAHARRMQQRNQKKFRPIIVSRITENGNLELFFAINGHEENKIIPKDCFTILSDTPPIKQKPKLYLVK